MALLDFPLSEPTNPVLVHDHVYLRHPQREDYDAWAQVRAASKEHLQPFEPVWAVDELSRPNFRKRLRAYARDLRSGSTKPYYIFRAEDEALVGGITLSNIRRRAAMTATVGYWVGRPYTRQGYARAAVCAVISHAFQSMQLERIEAATLPHNEPSKQLLRQLGFREEGYARQYLRINGSRQDHILFGLSQTDFEAALTRHALNGD
jgi:ribosomal-protein-alanine N-acetyltransferase